MGILARIIPSGARSDPNRAIRSLCAGIATLSGSAAAQVSTEPETDQPIAVERPSGANRVVRLFDFEEADFNPLPIPFGWIRAQNDPAVPRERPGFPIWNQGSLDSKAESISGDTTVQLPIEGGSTSLLLLPGSIGVFPGADYMVDAWVRTEGLRHARAGLTARLLDERGEPINGSTSVSAMVRTKGEWTRVSAIVPGIDERAAYLQIELLALQPEQQLTEFGEDARRERPFHVWREDYSGTAWFDDVAVTLLPRIELDTGTPGQVFRADETPSISVLVRDLTGERLSGNLRVFDTEGVLVDTQPMRSASGKLSETITPSLPGPGWYRAVLDVTSGGRVVGRGEVSIAWGSAEEDETFGRGAAELGSGNGMFALSADAWTRPAADALPRVALWAGSRRASVGVWHAGQTIETAQPGTNPAFSAVRSLIDLGIKTTIRFGESPSDLADLVGRDPWDISGALGDDQELWMPWAEQALDRFGQSVISWQIGDQPSFHDPIVLRAHTEAVDAVLSSWVPGPEIRTAMPIGDAIDPQATRPGRGTVVRDDGGGSDDAPAQRVREWASQITPRDLDASVSGSAGTESTMSIEFIPAPSGRATRHQSARTARRAIEAWFAAHDAGVADRVTLSLRDPLLPTHGRRPKMVPVPEAAVWRTLTGVLDLATNVRAVELIPGVRTILADGESGIAGRGVLVAWLSDPGAPDRTLRLPLADEDVTRVELLGQRSVVPIEPGHRSDVSLHRVEVSREPVIIVGVDAEYIELLASVRLTPTVLEPRIGQRPHSLIVDSPYDAPVQGKAFIIEPGGYSLGIAGRDRTWDISPRVISFVVPGGESVEIPVDLSFGASQASGWLEAMIDVEFSDSGVMPSARLSKWLRVAADELGMEISAFRKGSNVIVNVFVTNRGDAASSIDLTAFVPGSARQRSSISGVLPNATARRRYIFRDVAPGASVSVALSEVSSGIRLLERADLPEAEGLFP